MAKVLVLSVEDVVQRHEQLDGKRVQVRGWITECRPLSCILLSSIEDDTLTGSVSLGSSDHFDRALRRYQRLAVEVIVEGVVDRDCFDHRNDPRYDPNNDLICLDRAEELSRPRLIKVISRRQLAPGEAN